MSDDEVIEKAIAICRSESGHISCLDRARHLQGEGTRILGEAFTKQIP